MVESYKDNGKDFIKIDEKIERLGFKNLEKLADKINDVLETIPETRDDDHLLIGYVYNRFYKLDKTNTFGSVVKMVGRGELPAFESITRCRRKIQEQGLHLGAKRKIRKEVEEDVKEQIVSWGKNEPQMEN